MNDIIKIKCPDCDKEFKIKIKAIQELQEKLKIAENDKNVYKNRYEALKKESDNPLKRILK